MHGLGHGVADPGDGAEGVGAGPQVGHRAQVFEGVALLGDGVGLGIVDAADDVHDACLDFPVLALARRLRDDAVDLQRAAGAEFDDVVVVVERLVGHDLQVGEAGTVVDGDERKAAARGAPGLHPAADGDFGPRILPKDGLDGAAAHAP